MSVVPRVWACIFSSLHTWAPIVSVSTLAPEETQTQPHRWPLMEGLGGGVSTGEVSYHLHVVEGLEVEPWGCQHNPARVGDERGDFLSCYLSDNFLIEVLKPAGVERDLRATPMHYTVNLVQEVGRGRKKMWDEKEGVCKRYLPVHSDLL